jgi:hypothetical protein
MLDRPVTFRDLDAALDTLITRHLQTHMAIIPTPELVAILRAILDVQSEAPQSRWICWECGQAFDHQTAPHTDVNGYGRCEATAGWDEIRPRGDQS